MAIVSKAHPGRKVFASADLQTMSLSVKEDDTVSRVSFRVGDIVVQVSREELDKLVMFAYADRRKVFKMTEKDFVIASRLSKMTPLQLREELTRRMLAEL